MNLEKIEAKRQSFLEKTNVSKYTLESLCNDDLINFLYNSLALEGSSFNIKDIKTLLEGLTIGGKTLEEHLNFQYLFDAYQLLCQDKTMSQDLVLSLFSALKLKDEIVHLNNSDALDEVFIFIANSDAHPLEKGCMMHYEISKKQIFGKYSNLIGRLIVCHYLLNNKYMPISITRDQRYEYEEALSEANYEGLMELYIPLLDKRMSYYLKML